MTDTSLSRFAVVVQARTTSSRLPGKVLMDVEGQPMLLRQLRRLKHGLKIGKLIVATSTHPSDDPIEKLCETHGFHCFRGALDDVLLRYILLGRMFDVEYIVRVGGDDPLVDPECCNHLVGMQLKDPAPCDFIYASNRSGWPYGAAAELIRHRTLEEIHDRTAEPLYLEHIIPYFFNHPGEYRMLRAEAPEDIRRPEYCFSVDYPEDLELVRTIFRKLRTEGEFFPLRKVIELLDENPVIRDINRHLHQGFDH